MKNNNSILHYSLFVALIGMLPCGANAGVRVGNLTRSYAEGYQQVNAMRQQSQYYEQQAEAATNSEDPTTELPVRVADKNLANLILKGDSSATVKMGQLESCSMIYPNGEFAWDKPTIGVGAGGASTCVAVVELRGYQMGANGSDAVLARANLAAGDSVKCNISSFPEVSYTLDAGNVTFPHDNEPTVDDVIEALNKEQRQNAGIKIAAGAIIGAVGGNIAGKNDVGNDSLLGTDKGKLQGSAIGAISGAALMAGNAYAGKVAGDMILSTGVNAAAGAVMGNMVAVGDSVLRIEDCEVEGRKTSCLWGTVVLGKSNDKNAYYNINTQQTLVCDENGGCQSQELINIKLEAYPYKNIDEIESEQFQEIVSNPDNQYIAVEKDGKKIITKLGEVEAGAVQVENSGIFAKISSSSTIDRKIPAMIPDVRDKAFGMNEDDWREWKQSHGEVTIYGRNTSGQPYKLPEELDYSVNDFAPMEIDAEDGGLIDLGNKARLKATLTGAGVGGALGAFSAYQGAQSDIQNRWVTSVREYKDSLQKFYCVTGNRFLGYYNDEIIIPRMTDQ